MVFPYYTILLRSVSVYLLRIAENRDPRRQIFLFRADTLRYNRDGAQDAAPARPARRKLRSMNMKCAVVFIADGLEECEALVTVDLLRRAGIRVITASVSGTREVTSSHQITFRTDALAEEVDYDSADIVILPGGMPGTLHLEESEFVRRKCLDFAAEKYVAAICAAPRVLGSLGILRGRRATCYPGNEERLTGAEATGEGVVRDGNVITGQALGSAIPFALEIIRTLLDDAAADKVAGAIVVR